MQGDYNEATLGMPHAPMTWHDAVLVAAEWYHECRRTHSASPRYVRYKVNGGAWIEPQQDKSDILFHAAANNGPYATAAGSRHGRGDCMARPDVPHAAATNRMARAIIAGARTDFVGRARAEREAPGSCIMASG